MGTETLDVGRMYRISVKLDEGMEFFSEYSCLDEQEAIEWYISEFGDEIEGAIGRKPCEEDVVVGLVGYTVYDGQHGFDFYFDGGYQRW